MKARVAARNGAANEDGDTVCPVEFIQRAGGPVVDCPGAFVVTAGQCHDKYVDANAFLRRDSACFKCATGNKRRDAYSEWTKNAWENDDD